MLTQMLTQTKAGSSRTPAVADARRAMKVLVYVDASAHSQAGAELIRTLPLPRGSEVTLLAASTSEPRLGALLDSSIDQATALWAKDELLVKRSTLPDATAQQVTAYATAIQADVIVVSAQGVSSDVGKLLNGMVHQVAERAASPVLVALAPFTGLRRVLLAYDGSPQSQAAVRFLTQFPLPRNTDITVLHVLPELSTVKVVPPRWPAGARVARPRRATMENPTIDPADLQQAQDILAEGLGMATDGGMRARGRLACGDAAQMILREAEVNRADLVVVGTRGLGATQRRLLGSVSQRLVQSASQSVLIVPEN